MSKTLPSGLQAHLSSGSSSMVYCWKVTRTDNIVQTFTECDVDVSFGGDTYQASTGFTATTVSSELGLNVDNLNVDSVLSSSTINEDDLAAGRYDNADVELYWVNFNDTAMNVLIMKGSIGEVKRMETQFSAELRSQTHRLQQKNGETYKRFCSADVGDARCKVNLASASFSSTGTIASTSDNRKLTVTGLSNNTSNFYAFGKLTITSGVNSGLQFIVKTHAISSSTTLLTLWEETPQPIVGGTTFSVTAGCAKDSETCKTKFNNIINFRGFHLIPGNDFVTRYPTQGGSDQSGGSIF